MYSPRSTSNTDTEPENRIFEDVFGFHKKNIEAKFVNMLAKIGKIKMKS